MSKEIERLAMSMTAGRDQAMSFIRDNQQEIAALMLSHPDTLVKLLACFALTELNVCSDVVFRPAEDEEDG